MDKHSWHRVYLNPQSLSIPLHRWGHSCCLIGNQLIIFGGYAQTIYMNDIWSFNTITMQWLQIKTYGDHPVQKSNCTMSYDSFNNRIVIFGGGGPNKKRYNSINVLNWETKQWVEIQPKENQPAPWERTYHCSELLYPYLIVFGGQGVTDLDDLWFFNFQTLTWKQIHIPKTSTRPCARRFHSSALLGNQFFIIGGCYGKYRCLSDVYSLDLTPLIQDQDLDRLQWKDRKPFGSSFLTRWGHTSSVYDNKIYIFGGRFSNDLNDILCIDIQKNSIKAIKIVGELPKARRRHSACFIGSCMIIFGGFNGQYFNDLNYINIFQLKTKFQQSLSPSQKNLDQFINNKQYSDLQITTNTNQIFYLHKGLLINSFKNQSQISIFLSKINGCYSKNILFELIRILYKGYGVIQSACQNLYHFDLPNNIQDYQYRKKLTLFKSEEINQQNQVIGKKNLLPTIIQLNDDQFSSFLDQNRQSTYKDAAIIINDAYLLKTNSTLLAMNSPYFRNAFSGRYSDNRKQIKLTLNSNNLVIFQVALNYLLLQKIVIPFDMGMYSWMQLFQMADYFSIQKLKNICQQQICNFVNQINCNQIMNYSIQLQMQILSLYCADYLIKSMINNDIKYLNNQQTTQQKTNIIQYMYNISKFDILQIKLQRMKIVQDNLKKKLSYSIQQTYDKENYQTTTGNQL